jgi:predicted transcriptional regulator
LRKAKIKQHAVAYLIICKLTTREAYDATDLAYELDLSEITINKHLRELYSLDLIYICGWDRSRHESNASHHPVPVYRWGNKPDVKRPEPEDKAEINRRYRERIKNGHGKQPAALQ